MTTPRHEHVIADAVAYAFACFCLLGTGVTANAQDEEPTPDGLEPIVLQQRETAPDTTYIDDAIDLLHDAATQPVAEIESYNQQLKRLFTSFREAVLDSSFDEADTLAKQIVELSISVNGLDSRETATSLSNLAVAQHGMEDYQSAILNYTAAIGIIERIEDRLSGALVNPLRGLGAAQFASGRPDMATKAFDRAIHIGQVNEGPHNLEQIETLMSLTEIYLSVGETKEAVKIQKRIYYLQARNISKDSLAIIPALETRADWQHRMHMYEQERFTWRRIIGVIEKDQGRESLALIEPLTSLANSYLSVVYSGLPANAQPTFSSGDPYLKRAVRIAERNPEATLQLRIDTKLELGDYYIMTEHANRAQGVYRDVWNMLSVDESLLGMRRELLESNQLLRDVFPPKRLDDPSAASGGARPSGYRTGTALFEYDVNTNGRPTRVRLLEADPPGLDDLYKQIGRELRFIVHRPRILDGNVQGTKNLTFRHEFFYRDSDLETIDEQEDVATEKTASNQEPLTDS